MMQDLGLERFSNDVVRLDLTLPSQTSSTSLSIDEEESTEAKIRRLISEHPVIIFSRSSCCMCHVMKRLLATIGVVPTVIELDDHEVSSLPTALDGEYSGGVSVVVHPPAVFIGRECIGGLESLVALHLSGHLVPKLVQVGALWILEMGIVSHSIIVGISLGVSHSPCTIRPLLLALSFHQFSQGFALGGCVAEATLTPCGSAMMAFFFAITSVAIASSYNSYSVAALVAEGVLDSLSAGILTYMALVDLIAADFSSKKMSVDFKVQVVSYCFLCLGAGMMSTLAIWA